MGCGQQADAPEQVKKDISAPAAPPSDAVPGAAGAAQSPKPNAIVVNGPSGVGKGTLINKLMADFPSMFGFSVSHTTRGPRPGEEDGKHYHFSTREIMEKMIVEGEFIEHADVHGNIYGTSKGSVQDVVTAGKICILDIDVQGAQQCKEAELAGAQYVFVRPPSMEQLEARLRGRGTETEDKILKRLANAQGEIDFSETPDFYNKVVVNDELEACYQQLLAWMSLEKPAGVSWATLQKQNAECSQAIIAHLDSNDVFVSVSKAQEEAILQRDAEDAEKLTKGIQISIDRGSLAADPAVDPYIMIDVIGKTPDMVTQAIIDNVGEAATTGAVVVLCGLSGTGKGTTVEKLSSQLPNTVTWSNGNIFRSVTLLAATWCELMGKEAFDAAAALTAPNLKDFMGMLSFDATVMDIKIKGLGLDLMVNDVKNTVLKGPKVSANIPTVAQETQGEVVAFAAGAIEQMRAAGKNVLLEGREQTVDYVPSKFRFTLTLSDTSVIGKRRAAQVIGANALKELQEKGGEPTSDDVNAAVVAACVAMQ